LYWVAVSAATAGNIAAAGKAADSAALEHIPFIRALLEKSELMQILLLHNPSTLHLSRAKAR
jgi:hypothetical protein